MSNLEDMFDSLDAQENSNEPLPMGKYKAVVTEAVFEETKYGPQVKWEYSVTEGDHKNRKIVTWNTFTKKDGGANEIGMQIFKNNLAAFGKINVKYKAMPSVLGELVGKPCDIYLSVKQSGGKTYSTVYVNDGLLDDSSVPNIASDDEIPF